MPAHRIASITAVAAVLAAGLGAVPATAAALRVTPVSIALEPAQRFCALTLTNDDDEPVILQVRGFGWSRDGAGNDHFDPDAGVAVNPSIVTLAPNESALVRCSVPVRSAMAGGEDAWRLIVDELPDPSTPERSGVIRTRLRLSLPVFRAPAAAQPHLLWRQAGDGVDIFNAGTRHAKVLALTYREAGKAAQPRTIERSAYILAGGSAHFALPAELAAVDVLTSDGLLAVPHDDAMRIARR